MAPDPLEGKRLELDYPCSWTYTVVGAGEPALRVAVAHVLGDVDYELTFSHESRNGSYCSMHLELTIASEEERLRLFRALGEHPEIRYVL